MNNIFKNRDAAKLFFTLYSGIAADTDKSKFGALIRASYNSKVTKVENDGEFKVDVDDIMKLYLSMQNEVKEVVL